VWVKECGAVPCEKGMRAADVVTGCQAVADARAASHGCIMCSVT
jgi:hypothetical protein